MARFLPSLVAFKDNSACFSFFISLVVAPSSVAFGVTTRGSDNAVKLGEGGDGSDSKSGSALVWKGKEAVRARLET